MFDLSKVMLMIAICLCAGPPAWAAEFDCYRKLLRAVGRVQEVPEPTETREVEATLHGNKMTAVIEKLAPHIFSLTEKTDPTAEDVKTTLMHGPHVDDPRIARLGIHGTGDEGAPFVIVNSKDVGVSVAPDQMLQTFTQLGLDLNKTQLIMLYSCHSACTSGAQTVADITGLPVIAPTERLRLVLRYDEIKGENPETLTKAHLQVRDDGLNEPWAMFWPSTGERPHLETEVADLDDVLRVLERHNVRSRWSQGDR